MLNGLAVWTLSAGISALLVLGSLSVSAQPRQFALLIGIGNYPPEGGWQHINAPNDLVVIGDALQKRGFLPENIFLLKDQYATREGILNAWRQGLLPRIGRGDVVYFQFSGHGQQVADDNGDELDGYDEAIVPYDSPLRYEQGVYEGQNLIRDDELNTLLNELRRRLGPTGNVMTVLDACHSGTGTRGMEPARGTDRIMAGDDYIKHAAARAADGYTAPQFGAGAGELAPMAAFFGSAQNQLNFETRDEQGQLLGSLSYALSKKLTQAPPSMTYRGLFEQIRVEMGAIAPRQQPQAEGTLDQELLGGRLLEKPAFQRVIRWNDPGAVVIDAGWVAGLNEGAVVGLFPPETRNPQSAAPLARGTVSAVLPFEATLQLDNALDEQTARSAWAYVLEQNFGTLHLGLSMQLPENHPVRLVLLEKLKKYPVIRLDEAPEVFLTPNGAGLQLTGHGDLPLENLPGNLPPEVAAERIKESLLANARTKFWRQLEATSAYLQVDFEIVPVRYDARTLKETETIPVDSKRDALGNLHFQNGDAFRIRVNNRGDKAAYFTLCDIQPDNVMTVLIPSNNETPAEFRVGPGESLEVPQLFNIGPPAGVEMFKMIATEQAVDLRPVMKSRGAATRDPKQADPLEKLLQATFFTDDVQSRGGKTVNLAAGSLHVCTTTFIID